MATAVTGAQRWFFLFAGGSILIAILLLLFRGSDIPSAWNAFAGKAGGLAFDKVIPTAQSAGYKRPALQLGPLVFVDSDDWYQSCSMRIWSREGQASERKQ